MRKNKLKNYLKLGILLFGVFLIFTNCQKDDDLITDESLLQQTEPEIINQKISFDNSLHRENLNLTIGKLKNKLNISSELQRDNDSITIITDDVLYITYAKTHTYTFKVLRTNPEFYIENIVLHYNLETENYDEYLIQYNFTPEEYLNIDNGDFLEDSDKVTITDLESGFVSSYLSRGCIRSCQTIIVPCSSPSDHLPGQECSADIEPYSYQSCSTVCFDNSPQNNTIEAPGGSSGGGGSNSVISNPVPTEPCESSSSGNTQVGITGSNGDCLTVTPKDPIAEDDCLPNFTCRSGEFIDENCECQIDLLDPCANKDLINYQVSPAVLSTLESRQQPNSMVQSNVLVDSFILETIDDGWGDVNQDKFSIKIDQLPNGYTPFQLFNEIRMNFTNLVVGGDIPYFTDVNLEPYSTEDGVLWNSVNPVGAAMDFDTLLDTSTVYCVEYNAEEMYWVFATVTSYSHQGHFVAGIRQFGLEPNGSGGYSFYVRAADRLGGVGDFTLSSILSFTSNESLFTFTGDTTWNNLMENTVSHIQNNGGNTAEFDSDKTYGARHPYNENDCQD